MARQRGNSWQADVITPEGTRKRVSFKTRKEAEQYEADQASQAGTTIIGSVFSSVGQSLWYGSKDERNVFRIVEELSTRLGPSRRVSEITTADVESLKAALQKAGNKPSTVNTKLTRLSKLLKQCRKLGYIKDLPEIELLRAKGGRVRFLDEQEEKELRDQLEPAYRGLFSFLVYTGCRISEALALTWKDLDHTKATFWHTKSGKPRTVPLTKSASGAIPWADKGKTLGPFRHIPYFEFYRAFIRAREASGMAGDTSVVVHTLRHTCASRLVQKGVDIRRVKEWLGHSSIEMTMKYAHLAPNDLEEAARRLEA